MSTLRTDTLSNAAGTKSVPVGTVVDGSAKAWVNFNGTGTVAIRASFNVTSITDNGVSDYTVNFTTAMPDANYAAIYRTQDTLGSFGAMSSGSEVTATSFRFVGSRNSAGTTIDTPQNHVAIFR